MNVATPSTPNTPTGSALRHRENTPAGGVNEPTTAASPGRDPRCRIRKPPCLTWSALTANQSTAGVQGITTSVALMHANCTSILVKAGSFGDRPSRCAWLPEMDSNHQPCD